MSPELLTLKRKILQIMLNMIINRRSLENVFYKLLKNKLYLMFMLLFI